MTDRYSPIVNVERQASPTGILVRVQHLITAAQTEGSLRPLDVSVLRRALGSPTVSARLRAIREQLEITTAQVGRILQSGRVQLDKIESGRVQRSKWIVPLCELYGVSVDEVLRGSIETIREDGRHIGERIMSWRSRNGLSRSEGAALLGLSWQSVYDLERGRQSLDPARMEAVEEIVHGPK